MNIARYKEVEQLFVQVVDLPPEQREARISELTRDQELIQSVRELILENDRLTKVGFMESSVLGGAQDWEQVPTELPAPKTVQGHRIIRLLGRGASGTVYLAESPPPLERMVALKLINQGAGKPTLARFHEEQRLLAQMNHVGIAKVYDQGVSEDGRPFTVFEYIDGQSITEHCKEQHLAWRAIVDLVDQCCLAVSHAHQRNIIHRDLKPPNLMVSRRGQEAQIKVIDFGTAKLNDPMRMMTQLTLDSEFLGTLNYSSPEQLSGNEAPDTRTDVHALGIVMYECLEGKHPFYETGAGLKSLIDQVMTAPIPAIRRRPGVPARELSAILAKACAKDPAERYSSLLHFSEDLQRLLTGLPVLAMRPHPGYHLRKFVRRNRKALLLSLLIFSALVFSGAVAIERGIEANRSRLAMRGIAIQLVDDLMPKLADLNGSANARRELAASLHGHIDELLSADPSDRGLQLRKANVLEYKSDMLLSDGLVDESEALRRASFDIIQSLMSSATQNADQLPVHERRLLIKLGDISKQRGNYESARGYYERNHKLLLEAPGDQRESLCWSLERLGWIAKRQGRSDDGFGFAQQRLDLSRELYEESPDLNAYLSNYAIALQMMAGEHLRTGNFELGLNQAQTCLAVARQLLANTPDLYSSHATHICALSIIGQALVGAGRYGEAVLQIDRLQELAMHLVALNPERKDARNTAWIALQNVLHLSSIIAPERNMEQLRSEMQRLLPGKEIK